MSSCAGNRPPCGENAPPAVAGSPAAAAAASGAASEAERARLRLEERLRQVTEAARVVVWEMDLATGWTSCSANAAAIWGFTEGLAEAFFERIHPDDREQVRPRGEAGGGAERGYSREYRVLALDGSLLWLHTRGDVVTDAEGRPSRLVGVSMDITDRKRAEEALRRSERQFRAMFEGAAVGVALADPATGRFLEVNPTLCALTGYEESELIGRPFLDLTHPDDRELGRPELERMLRGETGHWRREKRYLRKDGEVRWVLVSASIVRDDEGRPWRATAIITDLTERRRSEEALGESRARERAYLEHLPVGVWFLNARGEIVYGNEAGRAIWAGALYVGAERFGEYKAWRHGTDRRLAPEEWGGARAVARGETTLDELLDIECFDGSRKTILNSAVPLRDRAGAVIGAVVLNLDVTERRRTERALQEAQAELREHADRLERTVAERTAELRAANEQLETFVYSVAHDLRSPLRALTGFAQLLAEDHAERLDAEGRRMLGRIQASSEFMDRLVLDLLDFGRAARAQIELGPVPVARAWEAAWFQCAAAAAESGASVVVEDPLPTVRAHEATLGQMLANLLGNAFKFVEPGRRPEVRFRAETRGERVRLWVEDKGIGIAPDQHERVFRVFERLHGARHAGTGVGLAIVRKGAERMGGSAGVESAPGEGSRFWIELPRA